jgi:hypothetical protein
MKEQDDQTHERSTLTLALQQALSRYAAAPPARDASRSLLQYAFRALERFGYPLAGLAMGRRASGSGRSASRAIGTGSLSLSSLRTEG